MKMGERKKASVTYNEEIQEILERLDDEEDYDLDKGEHQELMKKKRLCREQVKGLEKHFAEKNGLQPGRKMKIAEELGLEPRQVAVWFQNRRAQSKAKQLERDYEELRASFDALKRDYVSLEQQKNGLLSQLKELKAKIEARARTTLESSNTTLLANNPMPSSASNCLDDDGYDDQSVWKEKMISINIHEEEEESCNFFSVDQPPSLHYYSPHFYY